MYLLCKLNFFHNEFPIRVGNNFYCYFFLFINHSISRFTSLLNIPIVAGSLCGRITTILIVYFGLSVGKQPTNVNSSELLLLSSHCRVLPYCFTYLITYQFPLYPKRLLPCMHIQVLEKYIYFLPQCKYIA